MMSIVKQEKQYFTIHYTLLHIILLGFIFSDKQSESCIN